MKAILSLHYHLDSGRTVCLWAVDQPELIESFLELMEGWQRPSDLDDPVLSAFVKTHRNKARLLRRALRAAAGRGNDE